MPIQSLQAEKNRMHTEPAAYFELRRGRCFAEIDLITSRPRPVAGSGVFA